MINSAPRQPNKYQQGLFVPKNKDKVLILNAQGGLWYRSSLERKVMTYFDNNDNIKKWSAENLKVPYKKTEYSNVTKMLETTSHNYYPDFYYELLKSDGTISRVVAEVKPHSETMQPKLPQNPTAKQLKNFEYSLKMYNSNLSKWTYMIDYCKKKGFEFIIITEKHLK